MATKKKWILNCEPSQKTAEDWTIDSARDAGMLAAAAPPQSVDHRVGWWAIGNQGSTGSCVGWATADSVLRWHFTKAGRLAQANHLSVRFIWMAAKESDEFTTRPSTFIETEGTSLKAALDVARKFGAVTDDAVPFSPMKLYPGKQATLYALAAQRKITAYFNLGRNPAAWKDWLATGGPILTRLDVDDTWYSATETAGNLDAYLPMTAAGGHAVAMVGYTKDRFIIRNSWGTSWGDNGFAYASIPYAQAAFTEAYGVTI